MKKFNFGKFKDIKKDLIFQRVAELLEDRLPDAVGVYGGDLHNYVFNDEPAFMWTNMAEGAVDSVGVWSAIRLVKQYEVDNFGESNTEFEPCKIANMLTYIYGEFLLAQVESLAGEMWDRELTEEDLDIIVSELQKWADENLPVDGNYSLPSIDTQVWGYYGSYQVGDMRARFLLLAVVALPALGCESVDELADRWNVEQAIIANSPAKLVEVDAVDSVGGFNPYSVDFKSADDFEQTLELNADQKWKWLRYRRAEIGICFEDEFLNDKGQCELY